VTHHHAVLTVTAARKAAWLLQFLRPSLRRPAVTAVVFPRSLQQHTRSVSLVIGAVCTYLAHMKKPSNHVRATVRGYVTSAIPTRCEPTRLQAPPGWPE
jgi:hypothetical protein